MPARRASFPDVSQVNEDQQNTDDGIIAFGMAPSVRRAPTLINPVNGAAGTRIRPTFEWANVPNAARYVLQLFADTPDKQLSRRRYLVRADEGATTTFTFTDANHDTDPLRYGRTYYWTVLPRNANGENGPVSEKWIFTTRHEPVTVAPTLISPTNGATDRLVNPTFEWNNVPNAARYVVQLFADTSDNPIARRRYLVRADEGATTSFRISEENHDTDPLQHNRTHFWTVTPRNVDGRDGPESAKWSFTTRNEPVTVAPTLVNPTNGATDTRVNPTFEWNNVPNAARYVVQLFADTSENPIERRRYLVRADEGATTSFRISEESHDTDPLQYDRTYFWTVTPRNEDGRDGPDSAKWSFTTRHTPVTATPTLINPVNGANGSRVNPTFEWHNVPNAARYVVQLYGDAPDNSLPRRRYLVRADEGATTSFRISEESHDIDPLQHNRTYYWTVTPRNVHGRDGPESEKWSFTTRNAPTVTESPTLFAPSDGMRRTEIAPTFEWDNIPRASSYVLQLFADTPENRLERRRYIIARDAGATTRFTFADADHDTDPLRYERTYYWTVRGRDDVNDPGPVSEKWSFTTIVDPAKLSVDSSGYTAGQFNVDSSGAATYSIPLVVSPGVGGMEPGLALVYNSQSGNGLLGQGWSLSGLSSITRTPATVAQDGSYDPVDFDNSDRFSLDGQRLQVVAGNYGDDGSQYRTERESFSKIVANGQQAGDPASFTIWTKGGLTREYGLTPDSRFEAQGKSKVYIWALSRITDRFGNYWTVQYHEDSSSGEYYPVRIDYTANDGQALAPFASVRFSYEDRPDAFYGFANGSRISSTKRLATIQSFYQEELVREYRFNYRSNEPTHPSYLASVTEVNSEGISFQPLTFDWNGVGRSDSFLLRRFTPDSEFAPGIRESDLLKGDFNGDGTTDLIKLASDAAEVWLAASNNTFDISSFVPSGEPLEDAENYRVGDVNGDGLADVVHFMGPSLSTWLSRGNGRFNIITSTLTESFGNGVDVHVGDFDGDSRTDIAKFDGDKVMIAISRGNGRFDVSDYVPWAGYDVGDASRYKPTDLNGDGRTDFLHFYGNTLFTWIANGDGTFQVITGRSDTFVDNGNYFRIASINGDNKTDLFHFNEGEIDIWESRGDGTFRIRTYNPNVDFDFGGGRVKAADFNRDGFTDVIRFYPNRAELYFYTGDYNFEVSEVPLPDGYVVGEEEYFALGDWNGDGAADLLHLLGDSTNLWISSYQIPTRVIRFATPLGPEVNVQYRSIARKNDLQLYEKGSGASYPIIEYQRPLYVVSSQSVTDGIGGLRNATYRYGDAKYDVSRKAMLGFGWMEVIDEDAGLQTRTYFERHIPSGSRFVARTETLLLDGRLLSEVDRTTMVRDSGDGIFFAYPERVASKSYELDGSEVTSSIVVSAYDDFGNVVQVELDNGEGYHNTTTNTYDNLTGEWLIGLLRRSDTTYSAPSVADDKRSVAYTYYAGTKSLEQQIIEPDQENLSLITSTEVDGYGNVVRTESGGAASDNSLPIQVATSVQHGRTVATVTFNAGFSLSDGEYALLVDGAFVSAGGVSLGEDASYPIHQFFGDSDGDRDVDATDFSAFLDTYRRNVGHPNYSAVFDTDQDGDVDATDFSAFLNNYRKVLPQDDLFAAVASQPSSFIDSVVVGDGSGQHSLVQSITVYFDRLVQLDPKAIRLVTPEYEQSSVLELYYTPDGRFVERVRNGLGHENSFESDSALGLLKRQTDSNGLTTHFDYDGFGRIVREIYPDNSQTNFSYGISEGGNSPEFATRYAETIADGAGPSRTYYDSLFRPIRSEYTSFDGSLVRIDQVFDELGRVSKSSDPYFADVDDIVWSEIEYDEISRPVKLTSPGDRSTTIEYDGREVISTNAVNQSRTERVNAIGQLTSIVDNLNGVLRYEYDAVGNLIKSIDVEGNVTRMDYDDRGNQILLDDPNLGVVRNSYNVFGELVQQVDAKQQTRLYRYDQLGRLIARSEPEGVSSWQYDMGSKALGRLTSVTGPGGYEYTLTYDAFGRLGTTSLTPEAGADSYSIQNEYDELSRLKQLIYPSGFSVQYAYNDSGYLAEVTADGHVSPIWKADDVNASGQITQQTLGNGTVTNFQYDPLTAYLTGIKTPGIQDLSFEYNDIGTLTRRSDGLLDLSEAFRYDDLERLTSAEVFHGASRVSIVGVDYSPSGRIEYKSDVGFYNYAPSGADQPHAVQSIVDGTGATVHQYRYDANGNRIEKDGSVTAYNSFDKPISIEEGSQRVEFVYGPGRDRIRQSVFDADQLQSVKTTVDGVYEIEFRDGDVVETHYVSGGTGIAAIYEVVNGNEISTQYLHRDHLVSLQAISDESGQLVETLSFDAWGERRDPNTWLAAVVTEATVDRGFTGHEHLDSVGLIHMNGRVYDPEIGRFLSADPFVQDPLNSQSHDRYAYVFNNSLSRIDPTGYWPGFVDNFIDDVIPDEAKEIGEALIDGVEEGADVAEDVLDDGVDALATASGAAVVDIAVAVATGNSDDIAQAITEGIVDYGINSAAAAASAEAGPVAGAFVDAALTALADEALSGLFDGRPSSQSSGYGAPNSPKPMPAPTPTPTPNTPRDADLLEGSIMFEAPQEDVIYAWEWEWDLAYFYTGANSPGILGRGIGSFFRGGSASGARSTTSTVFYGTPQGQIIESPVGYRAVTAQNGQGLVLLPKGQALGNNSSIIRYGEPNAINPNGYIRYYNSAGQPLNPFTGKPGANLTTHIPPGFDGPLLGYPGR